MDETLVRGGERAAATLRRQTVLPAVLPVVLLSVTTLWWPESGDQALFIQAARQLRAGSVYYRDFWDIKQPGLYWFYELGEVIIPGGLGARLLECLLAVVAAWLVTVITAERDLRPSVRLAAPTMVLGPYLAYSYLVGVGQIEGLMNVLLLAVIACTWPTSPRSLRPGWAWVVAGLAVGVITLLKTIYVLVPLVVIAGAVLLSRRIDLRATARRTALLAAGAFVPVAVGFGYIAAHGVVTLALKTTFELPPQIATMPITHNAASRLELQRAVKNMFPVLGPLALAGLLAGRGRAAFAYPVTLAAAAVVELALALPQLWTPYRWLMLAAPVGLLAVEGLEALLCRVEAVATGPRRSRRRAALAVKLIAGLAAAALTVPMLRPPLTLVLTASRHPWGLDQRSRIVRGQNVDPITHSVRMADLVAGRVAPGTQIYVLGDPRITALLHATQGAEVTGWSMQLMPPVVWAELTRELDRSRPRFVFVDGPTETTGREAAAGILTLLRRQYSIVAATPDGTWYETMHPGEPIPTRAGNQMFH